MNDDRRGLDWFPLAAGLLFAGGMALLLWAALVYAPRERTMGDVQRIFYFHVPAATNALLAFLGALVGAVGYLATRRESWDRVLRATVETGVLWATVVLVTGPIWARAAWGAWWTWEPRLVTTLIAWLVYVGALLVRRISHDPEQGARLAAILAIVGFLDLPIVYKSVDWWRGNHPVVFGRSGGGLAPEMLRAFLLGMLGLTLAHAGLLLLRWRLARVEDAVAAAERVADMEEGLR